MVRDMDGESFARKAMVQCGLGLKNGVWKILQLRPELQEISRDLGADVQIVVMMNTSRMLSILHIDMNPNISGLQPNL